MAERKIRQAVVVIHGMGEHRPLETLNGFIKAGLPPTLPTEDEFEKELASGLQARGKPRVSRRRFYSRPDEFTESYEARRYLAPRRPPERPYTDEPETYAQTEFYEYHWAHLMQGNKLTDLWPTFTRMLLRLPNTVPSGLLVVYFAFWLVIFGAIWFFTLGPGSTIEFTGSPVEDVIRLVVGTGLVGTAFTYLIVTVLGGWVTSSFVDVVRYLDTSPRSYAVRHDIREGIIDLLQSLHESGRYQRIIIVAHSLGSYIAHDAITFLWGTMNSRHVGKPGPGKGTEIPLGLRELERAASALYRERGDKRDRKPSPALQDRYRRAQRALWRGLRANGNPWLITDLITLGSPMYFADRLYTRNLAEFDRRVMSSEFPTCPPESDPAPYNNIYDTDRYYSYRTVTGRRVLYHGAPFAVVRWTNMWFPARLCFFGDWFGGRLAPLYGPGIVDIELSANKQFLTKFPALAHARYFTYPDDLTRGSVTTQLRDAMELASTDWLRRVKVPALKKPRLPIGASAAAVVPTAPNEMLAAPVHDPEPAPDQP